MSEEEQRAFHTLLSSEELLESVAVLLEGEGDALHTPETRIARMEAVDVLGEAIAWRENPRRGVALSIARNAVLSENYHAVSSTWLKQDLVGDKLELIEVLRSEAPEELTRIVETAKEHGSNIGPVLRYAGLKG